MKIIINLLSGSVFQYFSLDDRAYFSKDLKVPLSMHRDDESVLADYKRLTSEFCFPVKLYEIYECENKME